MGERRTSAARRKRSGRARRSERARQRRWRGAWRLYSGRVSLRRAAHKVRATKHARLPGSAPPSYFWRASGWRLRDDDGEMKAGRRKRRRRHRRAASPRSRRTLLPSSTMRRFTPSPAVRCQRLPCRRAAARDTAARCSSVLRRLHLLAAPSPLAARKREREEERKEKKNKLQLTCGPHNFNIFFAD